MRILLLTQLFQPEPNHLKGLEFAKELVMRGHDVQVLTGYPNYPGGEIYSGYRQTFYRKEVMEGITVIRVPLLIDHSSSGLKRMLCYISLALTMCFPGLFLVEKPDVVHVYQGPATLAFPAMLNRLFRGTPYVLDVQDLWPESVLSSGMLRPAWLAGVLSYWCKMTYRFAEKIVVLSSGYYDVLVERGVPTEKIEVVRNWCDESLQKDAVLPAVLEDVFKLSLFTIVYAGNVGVVQRLDAVVGAAEILAAQCPNIKIVLVGDGVDLDRLKNLVTEKNLENVVFVPRQPSSSIGAILNKADALLVHLRDDPLCRIGIPQKTQAYLAAGRPVIIGVKGNAAELVIEAGGGIACKPEDPDSLAEAIMKLYRLCPAERERMARNGRLYYERELSFSVGAQKMESIFLGVLNA